MTGQKTRKTKAQLEDQIDLLKDKVRNLSKDLNASLTAPTGDLGEKPHKAFGLFKDDSGHHKFAKFLYNPETKVVEFEAIDDASRVPLSPDLAKFNLEELISDEIFKRLEEDYV